MPVTYTHLLSASKTYSDREQHLSVTYNHLLSASNILYILRHVEWHYLPVTYNDILFSFLPVKHIQTECNICLSQILTSLLPVIPTQTEGQHLPVTDSTVYFFLTFYKLTYPVTCMYSLFSYNATL